MGPGTSDYAGLLLGGGVARGRPFGRGRKDGLALPEQAVHQARGAVPGIPSHAENRNHHVPPSELQGLVDACKQINSTLA